MCPICLNLTTHDLYCPRQPGAFPLTADDVKVTKHEGSK